MTDLEKELVEALELVTPKLNRERGYYVQASELDAMYEKCSTALAHAREVAELEEKARGTTLGTFSIERAHP